MLARLQDVFCRQLSFDWRVLLKKEKENSRLSPESQPFPTLRDALNPLNTQLERIFSFDLPLKDCSTKDIKHSESRQLRAKSIRDETEEDLVKCPMGIVHTQRQDPNNRRLCALEEHIKPGAEIPRQFRQLPRSNDLLHCSLFRLTGS
ncbi:hypothetical protein Q664_14805 [Archangium violaceum Cb vi76]|uniref:Uncharacterized protein n=1 Tax=Archangium violaceum Cb vi76 TaxID=1406225 RepID=A0A084SVS3_9BACT|nr:hypothetical protein Q664_14805 [Archangium violaceum Cb vi76]